MNSKVTVIGKSVLWCLLILLFPIASGVIAVVLSLGTVETLMLQGTFMVFALIPPVVGVLCGKWHWNEIGFGKFDIENCKRVLFFIPVLAIFVPVAMKGLHIKSIGYVLGSLYLYSFVGISEEIYFRGIIPKYLKKEFADKGIIVSSILIFGVGHMAAALSGSNVFETALTVFNAFIFGWLAIEMTMLARNIIPAILIHILFDFETKIVAMSGNELLMAESVRGVVMFILALWLAVAIIKGKNKRITGERR